MSAKTIFIIILSVIVTIVLMKNTDDIPFWLFGEVRISKLVMLGIMFGSGFAIGLIAGNSGRKESTRKEPEFEVTPENEAPRSALSDEDRDYIS